MAIIGNIPHFQTNPTVTTGSSLLIQLWSRLNLHEVRRPLGCWMTKSFRIIQIHWKWGMKWAACTPNINKKINRPSASSSFIEPARALRLFSQPSSSRFSAAKVEVRKQLQCAGTVWCFWSVLVVFPPALHSFTTILTMQIQFLHLPDAKMLRVPNAVSAAQLWQFIVCGETRFSSFYPCPKVFKLEIRWYKVIMQMRNDFRIWVCLKMRYTPNEIAI